ncbi:MAG: hypothetical protein K5931_07285, partial [Lachnospiraceae bacterium]|nr:hypothetical protein [Lachnospiraceae bacterium]
MRKLLDHITIILFGAFITAIFLLYLLLPQTEFSDVENRYLTLRPKISFESLAKGSFMTDFDSYTAEQLPFRNAFVKLKALTEKFLLKKENNNIVEGSDSYLFEKLSVVNERLTKNEEIIKSFAKENDRRINVAIVPNSFEILKEKVPRGLPLVDEKKEIDKFYKDL